MTSYTKHTTETEDTDNEIQNNIIEEEEIQDISSNDDIE